jgi:hypothetical protein
MTLGCAVCCELREVVVDREVPQPGVLLEIDGALGTVAVLAHDHLELPRVL